MLQDSQQCSKYVFGEVWASFVRIWGLFLRHANYLGCN